MLIGVIAIVIVVAAVRLTGGQLSTLARLRLRGTWLVATALAVQVVIISILDDPPPALAQWLHLATYGCITIFILMNRSVPRMSVIAVGGASNFAVIAANHGVMPASAAALRTAGRTIPNGFNNSFALPHPRLSFLGDVLATPSTLPLANVFSIGDITILIGLALLVTTVSRTSPTEFSNYLRPAAPLDAT